MGATYTYLIADLRTGLVVDELPLSGVTFDKKLNDGGTLRGSLPVADPVVRDREPRLLTEPGRSAVYVDRDGELVWGGIIWTSRYSALTGVLELGAADFLSYFEHRYVLNAANLDQTVDFPGVDQVEIARTAITMAQAHPGGNLGISLQGATSSGITRTLSYSANDLKPVADLLRDLANAERGFDFSFDVRYDENARPQRFLRIGYPRIGQPGAPHVWEYGANMVDFTWPVDASSMATRVFAQGTADDGASVVRRAEDTAAYAAGWPLLENSASQLDTRDTGLLDEHARGELAATRRPVALPELVVRADLDPILGRYSVGDSARIVVDDPFFARDQLDATLRIVAFEVNPGDDAGQEEVKLTVMPILEPS
jgi:hypothetical protein